MKTINLTQHIGKPEQNCFEPADKEEVKELLTIHKDDDVVENASALADIAKKSGAENAMIGGAGFLLSHLEKALCNVGVNPIHSFSARESYEGEDGVKKSIFRHKCFIDSKGKWLP